MGARLGKREVLLETLPQRLTGTTFPRRREKRRFPPFHYSEIFDAAARTKAGPRAHIIIRETTCRLFGYHGLVHPDGDFSPDHMFGF